MKSHLNIRLSWCCEHVPIGTVGFFSGSVKPLAYPHRNGTLLFVVVGFVVEDGHGAVDLFDEEEADHLVGEGHFGEGEFFVGAFVDAIGEAVRSTDDEDDLAGTAVHVVLNLFGEVHGAWSFAAFVEKDDVIGGLDTFEEFVGFTFFLLGLGKVFGVLDVRNFLDLELEVVFESLEVVVDKFDDEFVVGFADNEEEGFHERSLVFRRSNPQMNAD